jgi:hypothetical protein
MRAIKQIETMVDEYLEVVVRLEHCDPVDLNGDIETRFRILKDNQLDKRPMSENEGKFRLRDELQSFDMIASQTYQHLRIFVNILAKFGKAYELGTEYKNTQKDATASSPEFEELNLNDFDFDPEDYQKSLISLQNHHQDELGLLTQKHRNDTDTLKDQFVAQQ